MTYTAVNQSFSGEFVAAALVTSFSGKMELRLGGGK
jgi:hypothetical protein